MPTRYVAMIDGAEGAYGLVVPDCPGCTAMGDTVDEAISNGIEALADWVGMRSRKGVPPPSARPLEAVRSDPMVIEALADGALPILIPLLLDSGRTTTANISLDSGLLAAIDDAAKARRMTRSAFIASAARKEIASSA